MNNTYGQEGKTAGFSRGRIWSAKKSQQALRSTLQGPLELGPFRGVLSWSKVGESEGAEPSLPPPMN